MITKLDKICKSQNTGVLSCNSVKKKTNGISVTIDNYIPNLKDTDINDLVDFSLEVCYAKLKQKELYD